MSPNDARFVSAVSESDVNAPGPGHNLRNYWVRGEGAVKIRWGTDGSFARCVSLLGEHVKNPQGLCAEYHKAATGEWPAEKGVESSGETTAALGYAGSETEVADVTIAATKEPYGDVEYADTGLQPDGVKRYPLNTEAHVRAAWSYINQPDNAAKYTAVQLRRIKARIRRAMLDIGAQVADSDGDSEVFRNNADAEADGDCPPKHHKMPDGTCMSDDEMTYALTAAAAEVAEKPEVDTQVDENVEGDVTGPDAPTGSAPWHGVLTVEGIESGDGRMFAAGSLTWDTPPLPLMWQKVTSHGGQSDVSVSVGSIDRIWREPDPAGRVDVNIIKGAGTIDLGNPDGLEVRRRMSNDYMRGNSVDVDSVKGADVELTFPEPTVEMSADGETTVSPVVAAEPVLTTFHRGRIRATTLVEIPAFTEARLQLGVAPDVDGRGQTTRIELGDSNADEDSGDDVVDGELSDDETLVAAVAVFEITDAPPRSWFERPTDVEINGALTVLPSGRIYGRLAPARVRHRAYTHVDRYVPMRNVDYDRFHGGETIVADGGRVSTGVITMNCGHASTLVRLSGEQAMQHYDNTCSVVASARVGEDRDGVWIAGALLPDVTPDQVRRIMSCRLSGDWRAHLDRSGWTELVAALLVPVPGFPEARSAPSVSLTDGVLTAASVPVQVELPEAVPLGDRVTAAASRVRRARVRRSRSRITEYRSRTVVIQ